MKILLASERVTSERDALANALADLGHDVRLTTVFELPFAAAHEQPDLAAVDVGKLRAEEIARLLRESLLGCPVVLLTDRPAFEHRDLALRCSAAGCLAKGSAPVTLARSIDNYLPGGREAPRESVDYVELSRRSTRHEFVAQCPFPFLISGSSVVPKPEDESTADMLDPLVLGAVQKAVQDAQVPGEAPKKASDAVSRKPAVMVLAVRAASENAEAITVGRAKGVDVYIDHATISKLHARFVREKGGLRLVDAGSRNGTWISGRLLEPNGAPSRMVESEDVVRLGELRFTFLSPAAAWDVLRVNVR